MDYDQFMADWESAERVWKQKTPLEQVIDEARKLFPGLPMYPTEDMHIRGMPANARYKTYRLPPEGGKRRLLLKTGTHGEDEIRIYPPDAADPIEE